MPIYSCNNCYSNNLEHRMYDVDGTNLVEDFTCLDCNQYHTGQPPIVEYKHLSQDQVDFITKHYKNQETADDVQELLILAREVGFDITFDLVTFEDCTADLVIKREDGKIKYLGDLCSSHLWLSKHIQAFGGGIDIALDILDDVLAWLEEGEQEELNSQALKANFLIDLLLNNTSNYYLDDGLILLRGKELDQLSKTYNQMLAEIVNPEIQKIIYASYDQKYKFELQLLNLLQ